jgi:chaperone required for assembly of F1-ATPase
LREFLNDSSKIEFYSDPNPMKRAQKQMLTPLVRRFYKQVSVVGQGDDFFVLLDDKPVKTPARHSLAFPTRAAAELVAAEFSNQQTEINPTKMPVTRLANTAIDGVVNEIDAVLDDIKRFCGNDLLCYRADAPDSLVLRQTDAWDAYLNWIRDEYSVRLSITEGVMHVRQPVESIEALGQVLVTYADSHSLTCLHAMTTLMGSAVLALAVATRHATPEEAWGAAHLDEDWTIENWGPDDEAIQRRDYRWLEMIAAVQMLRAIRSD